MARIRYIKPEFFVDSELTELTPLCRIFFAGLWCHADREGRLEDKPRELKVKILPYDDADAGEFLKLMDGKFIKRYEVNGKSYIQIVNFLNHQHPHVKEVVSVIPPPLAKENPIEIDTPSQHHASTVPAPCKTGASTPGNGEWGMIYGNRNGKKETGDAAALDLEIFDDPPIEKAIPVTPAENQTQAATQNFLDWIREQFALRYKAANQGKDYRGDAWDTKTCEDIWRALGDLPEVRSFIDSKLDDLFARTTAGQPKTLRYCRSAIIDDYAEHAKAQAVTTTKKDYPALWKRLTGELRLRETTLERLFAKHAPEVLDTAYRRVIQSAQDWQTARKKFLEKLGEAAEKPPYRVAAYSEAD